MTEPQQNGDKSGSSWETCWDERSEERWADWWRSDRLDSIGWAAIFFWGALVILAEATGFADGFMWWHGWSVFFTGAGIIVLFEALVRLLIPAYHQRMIACLIFGVILLNMGVGGLGGWFWALALIVIGSTILRRVFVHER